MIVGFARKQRDAMLPQLTLTTKRCVLALAVSQLQQREDRTAYIL